MVRPSLLFVASFCCLLTACGAPSPPTAEDSTASGSADVHWSPPAELLNCARCHAVPRPEILPKSRWKPQLERMAALIEQYRLGIPMTDQELAWAIEYYTKNAPDALPVLPIEESPSPIKFASSPFASPGQQGENGSWPIASHLEVVDFGNDGKPEVLISDMQAGTVSRVGDDGTGRWVEQVVGLAVAPARSTVFDADQDGDLDIAVAALGSVGPTEGEVGQVLLFEDTGGKYTPKPLVEGLPRTSDVRAADVDGDGDQDLILASFGMFTSGGVSWLKQADGEWQHQWIYRRNGVSHVPTVDLDRDGNIDVLAMVSQEHEEIVALLNRGQGRFESRTVYKAPHPMFGMSNLILADLDDDGDQDALFTNGDALDAEPYPKPWHGVHWLENRGDVVFKHHEISRFYGAYSLAAGDLDGDGDLDIVATSMTNDWQDPARQSIIWLENDGQQNFTRHPMGNTPIALVASTVVDLDQDGRLDVLAGAMNVMPPFVRVGRVAIWHNQGPAGP